MGDPERRPIGNLRIYESITVSWMFLTSCEEKNEVNRVQNRENKLVVANTVLFLYLRGHVAMLRSTSMFQHCHVTSLT
jgi:hypothetical protein